jgi:hypothetical protein
MRNVLDYLLPNESKYFIEEKLKLSLKNRMQKNGDSEKYQEKYKNFLNQIISTNVLEKFYPEEIHEMLETTDALTNQGYFSKKEKELIFLAANQYFQNNRENTQSSKDQDLGIAKIQDQKFYCELTKEMNNDLFFENLKNNIQWLIDNFFPKKQSKIKIRKETNCIILKIADKAEVIFQEQEKSSAREKIIGIQMKYLISLNLLADHQINFILSFLKNLKIIKNQKNLDNLQKDFEKSKKMMTQLLVMNHEQLELALNAKINQMNFEIPTGTEEKTKLKEILKNAHYQNSMENFKDIQKIEEFIIKKALFRWKNQNTKITSELLDEILETMAASKTQSSIEFLNSKNLLTNQKMEIPSDLLDEILNMRNNANTQNTNSSSESTTIEKKPPPSFDYEHKTQFLGL